MPIQRPVRGDLDSYGARKTFADAVGSYLCSRGLTWLNQAHLAGESVPEAETLAERLYDWAYPEFVADLVREKERASMPAAGRLTPEDLERRSQNTARWVIQHWDPAKIEGRRRGGRNGHRMPTVLPFQVALLADMTAVEAAAHLGCSISTIYRNRAILAKNNAGGRVTLQEMERLLDADLERE
jgi:hypothetical protein